MSVPNDSRAATGQTVSGSGPRVLEQIPTYTVPKVWGEEHWIVNRAYCGKKMILRKGFRCSLHMHKEKDEVFYVASGRILLELGDGERVMGPGDHHHIPQGVEHRFWGLEDAEIFEFSSHHEDDDSYRVPGQESGPFSWAELRGRVADLPGDALPGDALPGDASPQDDLPEGGASKGSVPNGGSEAV